MARHTIYIDDTFDAEIREAAQRLNVSISEMLKRRISEASTETRILFVEQKLDAMFALLDFIVSDLGYVVGATRAGSKSNEKLFREGQIYEESFRRMSTSLRGIYQQLNTKKKDG
jgi:hypothetical protein